MKYVLMTALLFTTACAEIVTGGILVGAGAQINEDFGIAPVKKTKE